MKLIKPAGDGSAWQFRRLTLHGSSPKRGMAKNAGLLRVLAAKPKGGRQR